MLQKQRSTTIPDTSPLDSAVPDAPSVPAAPGFSEAARATFAQALTLETVLWIAIAILALLWRLADLDRWALSEAESALALEAWHRVSGAPQLAESALADGTLSPLAFNLTTLFFALFGASDTTARLAQALGGSALVLAPWSLRPLLGRGHALAMSGLLLVSPSVLFFSRQASGDVWGALFALLLVAWATRWYLWGAARDGIRAALALGLGLATAPGFWSVLAAGGLFWLWTRRREGAIQAGSSDEQAEAVGVVEETDDSALPVSVEGRSPASRFLSQYGLLAAAAFVLGSTGFLLNLSGLGAALNLPLRWVTELFGSGPSLVWPFLFVVLLYESLLLIVGLIGGSMWAESRPRWVAFAFIWLGVTLFPAAISNSGWAGGLLYLALPLALLGAAAVVRLMREVVERASWQIDGYFALFGLSLLLYFWINLSGYLSNSDTLRLLSAGVAVLFLLIAIFWGASTFGRAATLRATSLTLLLLLAIVSLSTTWGLSMTRGGDPREPLVVQPADRDLRTGAAQLAQISIERYRDPAAIPLAIQRQLGPAPRWYFRNFDEVTLVEGSHSTLPEAALLDAEQPAPPERIGQRIWVDSTWQPAALQGPALARWLVTREETSGLNARGAILYLTLQEQ